MKTKKKKISVHSFVRSLNNLLKDYFAQYIVLDDCGTRILCWSMKEAKAWLPYCGAKAFICDTLDYCIIEARSY